ncbi:proteoglycan 4b isoform X1 [Alosa pseudoharengus]|uniref:proteoglycan 4b isoform X1 n=1 Tax=Alosa pseudoharengus TaxID=34774 RepID=UPI003F8889F2
MTRSSLYALLVLVCVTFTYSAAQSSSCTGRCGEEYYRGYLCHCDYDCLTHDECCKDYEAKCTTRGSCKGRCGESFKRGRQCDCDPDCGQFGHCCPDFKQFCNPEEVSKEPANAAAATEGPNPCLNAHASKPADPPQDSEAQSEGEDGNEDISDSMLSPTDPPYEEPLSPAPEDGISGEPDIPEEPPLLEGTSGYEPLATSVPETIDVVTPKTSMSDDAEAVLDEEQKGDPRLDDLTPPAVPDPTSFPSPVPASQMPTMINPDSTPPPSNPSDPASTQASTPAPEGEDQASMTQSPASGPTTNPASDAQQKNTASDDLATTGPPEAQDAVENAGTPAAKPTEAQTTTAPPPSASATVPTDQTQDPKPEPSATQDPAATPSAPEVTVKPLEMTPQPLETQKPGENMASTEAAAAYDDLATTGPPEAQDGVTNAGTPAAKPTEAQDAATTAPPPSASATVPTDQTQDPKPEPSATQDPATTPSAPEVTVKPLEMTPRPLETTAKPVEKTTKATPLPSKPTKAPKATPLPSKPTKAPKATLLPSKPTKKPEKPSSANDINFPGMDNSRDYQSDDSNDTNLCSGRPVNGLTTLKNGTTVVFRGHYFWMLDTMRVPGPARGITETWGIPSPIDTVFTRCNCQGKTYFLKGRNYWRFENQVMDPGYPKATRTGFDGLTGHITAALSVPAYMRRRESVYFFKRGGRVQKYSYDPKKAPKCSGSQPPSQPNQRVHYAVYTRRTRQAETYLGKELSITATWEGFPTTVTSALSLPSRQAVDGYKYYVFSRTRHYSIRMEGEKPTVTTPPQAPQTQSTSQSFFNCPKTAQS